MTLIFIPNLDPAGGVGGPALESTQQLVLADTTAILADTATIDSNTAAIKTAVELLDDTISTNVHTGNKELQTVAKGHICAENSTTTELAGGGVFTGSAWQDCLDYGTIVVSVFTDQNSATNGLVVQWSADGIQVMDTDPFTILANNPKSFSFGTNSRYIRVVYTNGATLQGTFILQTMLKPGYTKPSSHRIQDAIVGEDDAELVKAVLTAKNPGGTFVNATATTAGNLKVSVEEFDAGALGQEAMAASLPVVIASNQSAVPTLQSSALIPVVHDYIGVDLSGATSDVYTYKTGGSGGTLVATLTISYTGVDKGTISSIART